MLCVCVFVLRCSLVQAKSILRLLSLLLSLFGVGSVFHRLRSFSLLSLESNTLYVPIDAAALLAIKLGCNIPLRPLK